MDVGTGLALFGSAELATRFLGPSADYIGEGIKSWTELRVENVRSVFEKATTKVGPSIHDDESVPSRVLARILDDGSYSSDSICTDYFGGILASSRSGISRDDRGASWAATAARLSAYQLRTHYILYTALRRLYVGESLNVGALNDCLLAGVFLPMDEYHTAMAREPGEDFDVIVDHAFWGLAREDLILTERAATGDKENLAPLFPEAPGTGIVFCPTSLGVEFFLWAHGYGKLNRNEFFNENRVFELVDPVEFPPVEQRVPFHFGAGTPIATRNEDAVP